MRFQDYYNERQFFNSEPIDTTVPNMPYVGAQSKSPQETGSDPTLRSDYQMIVDTLKKLQHPKVQQKLYDWIKATFVKTPRTGSSAVAVGSGSPDMHNTQDVIAPVGGRYGLHTSSTPKQLSAFKGQTTKLGKMK